MFYFGLALVLLVNGVTPSELDRPARSDQRRSYASDSAPPSSVGNIGVRSDPADSRDAAYFESRCITCDPNKSATVDRGSRLRPRYEWYDDDDFDDRRYRDRYYDDYERSRGPGYDYDRYDRYGRYDLLRPLYHGDRYDTRYDRDRQYFDRNYDRLHLDRGNGYDNLDLARYPYDSRTDRYNYRRPYEDPSYNRYDRYNRNYGGGGGGGGGNKYDRYDPYDRINSWRRPYDDRFHDRYQSDDRAYHTSGTWGPGYDRGYASGWNYAGNRDNWRDYNRDRDQGYYRPRDYYYDSTAAPGGSRGTSYLHDRPDPESSTKAETGEHDKTSSSPQAQDSKIYKN